MAKWGEGDPRWIVEERPDATNVNNWHWTEKNATEWSKNRFRELFEQEIIQKAGVGQCKVTRLSDSTGEAYVNNRKSKLIFFYEWSLEFEWTGNIEGDETEYSGKIKIPNFSEEFTIDEVDVDITTEKSNDGSQRLKALLEGHIPTFRRKLSTYLKQLKEEYSKDLILPTKGGAASDDGAEAKISPNKSSSSAALKTTTESTASGLTSSTVGVRIATQSLHLTEEFHCTAEDIYRALTIKEMVQAFTRSDVVWEATKGGKFSLFGGMVMGEFVELEKNQKIVQKWRFQSWPAAHYSKVELNFRQTDTGTVVDLNQSGIPSSDFVRTRDGWKRYYWDAVKCTFGFGAMLT